jgi:BirA family transcriptional regulator, biotin operon repressor / biotin---[acetyl-CoA-carboxylase] ligase
MPLIGSEILKFKSLPSTNEFLKQRLNDYAEGTVIVADHQSRGRGRGENCWLSREGEGLYFSILLKPNIAPKYLGMLSLAAAVATANAMSSLTASVVNLKWPNDVILNNKKIAGILLESQSVAQKIEYVILGIGLNLAQTKDSWPKDMVNKAGSIYSETGLLLNKVNTLNSIINSLELVYSLIHKQSNWPSVIRKNWELLCGHFEKPVCILNKDRIKGKFIGLSEFGEAIVETVDGEQKYSIGEFSLREV